MESLRREKQQYESRISDLRDSLERSAASSRGGEADKARIRELEAEIDSTKESLSLAQRNVLEERNKASQAMIEKESHDSLMANLRQQLEDLQNAPPPAPITISVPVPSAPDMSSPEVQILFEQRIAEAVRPLESKLDKAEKSQGDLQNQVSELVDALASAAKEAKEAQAKTKNVEAALKAKEIELQESLISKDGHNNSNGNSSGGGMTEEDLKSVMQDVYLKACEIFVPEDEAESVSYSSGDVVKRLRAVLKAVTTQKTQTLGL